MKRLAWFACMLGLALLVPCAGRAEQVIAHGRFEQVHVYRPAGAPRQFVLFLSGDKGWTAAAARQAALLAKHGAMVAGVDLPRFEAKLVPGDVPVGDLENLAHYVQGYARLATYHTPLLAAAPTALAFARALKSKPPADLFAGVLAAGDAPRLVASYDRLAAANRPPLPPPPASLAGLPLVEVPATGRATTPEVNDTFAIMLSGDGGWAGLDKDVAAALASQGVAVVGLDSLRYFWSKRTPEGLANDLDRVVRYYAAHWKRSRVVLIGYSQGANALPASFNRLPEASRQRVDQLVLIGLEHKVAWQFHLSNWIGSPADAQPILPDAIKLSAATTLCLYGEGDGDTLCPELPAESVTIEQMPGGHHFNGAFDELAAKILARLD
ncbi:MAG TPA: AcvB/VirJ family lysyl-phosphatidylglycerol hydrolase [Caulobacteraceae bacterium]